MIKGILKICKNKFILINAVLSIAFYITYSLDNNTILYAGSKYFYLTAIPFTLITLIIFRHLLLSDFFKDNDNPVIFLEKDKTLLINIFFYIKNHILICIFFSFFILYFTIGLYFSFFNDIISATCDVFFDMDSSHFYLLSRTNDYFFENFYKHPLIYIIMRPFFLIFNALFNSPRAGTLFMQALAGSSTVCLIYTVINKLIQRKNISLFLSLIYGFSFSTVIFSSVYEFYIYSGFFNTLLIYYASIFWNDSKPLKIADYILLSLLLIFSSGIITVTCIANTVLVFSLFIRKNQKFKNFIYWFLFLIILYALNLLFVKIGYSRFFVDTSVTSPDGLPSYLQTNYDLGRFLLSLKTVFAQSFYGLNTEIGTVHEFYNTEGLFFADKQPILIYFPALLFIFVIICGFIKNIKLIKSSIALPLILITIVNIFECYFYNTKYSFLFSQNILPYLIILTGILFCRFSDKFINIFCSLFIFWQILSALNILPYLYQYAVLRTAELSERVNFLSGNLFKCFLYALISVIVFGIIIFCLKKYILKDKSNSLPEDKIRFYVFAAYFYMIIVFVYTAMFRGTI